MVDEVRRFLRPLQQALLVKNLPIYLGLIRDQPTVELQHGRWFIPNRLFSSGRRENGLEPKTIPMTDGSTTNPQFRIFVTKKTTLIISLMQEDEVGRGRTKRFRKGPDYITVNFIVMRVKSKRDRLWNISMSDIVLEASRRNIR